MTLTLIAEPPPLAMDDQGSVRVAGTRVLLELIVRDQRRGLSPEQIAERYETIDVPTAYAVVAYYLKHKSEVDAYVARREIEAEDLRRKIEANLPPAPTKQELLSRRKPSGD